MNDLQRKYHAGEIEPAEYIQALERRLAEAELNIQALAGTQFDAIMESGQTTPLLLRQAQDVLQRSNELLEQRVAARTAALAESELKYRALFENSLDMVFLTRTDGAIVDANPAACQALGMTREEIRARGLAGIIKPDEQLADGLKRRATTSRGQGELTFIRKEGSTFLAEVDSVIVNPEWKDWTTFVTVRDITKRRQAEQAVFESNKALQESEMRLRIAQDVAQLGIHDYDILNNQIYWDGRVRELWGIPPDRAITYEVFIDGLHPDDKIPTQAAVDRALDPTGNRDYNAEYRVIGQADQVERWVAATGQAFFDEGRAVRLVGTVQEITQRKQAEAERERLLKEVQRQKDLVEQLIQHSPIGIAVLQSPEHRFVLANPAQKNLFPMIPDFTGHTVAEVWPDQSELFIPILDRVFQTGEPYYAFDAPRQTDKGQGVEEVFYTFSYTPIYQPNGVIEGILVLSLETTEQVKARQLLQAELDERRQMEAALQESESRFRTMADGTPVMIWVTAPDGQIEFVNQAYTDYFGVTIEQVKTEGWQPLVHPEDATGYVDVFIESLQQHRTFRAQCRVRRPDGQWYWLDSHGQPRFSAAGEFIGMAGSSLDITQRKLAEEAIKRYAAQLEHLNRDLAFANRELKDFAYIASHDLQEPLRKVSQFGRMLQMNAGETLTEDNQAYLDRMVDAAKRMQEMLAGLLDYSRITNQGNPFTQVDLSQIAHEVLSDLEVRIEQTEGSVEIDSLPIIDSDPLLMRQLFQNLIGNALKFHQPDHPPIVKVWAGAGFMEGKQQQYISLHFQDNGIGFDEQHLDKLFLPFVRLHGRSDYEGSGMGLSICRKITKRHGGTITAKSSSGAGATFIVTLPKEQHHERPDD